MFACYLVWLSKIDFCNICDILNSSFPCDLQVLKYLKCKKKKIEGNVVLVS